MEDHEDDFSLCLEVIRRADAILLLRERRQNYLRFFEEHGSHDEYWLDEVLAFA